MRLAEIRPEACNVDIAHVIGALAAGGAERFVVNLTCELARAGSSVELWSMSNRSEPVTAAFQRQLHEAGVGLRLGPTAKIGAQTVSWYRQLLSESHPTILHLHTPNTELLHFLATMFSGRKRRVFRTLHSSAIPRKIFQKLVFLRSTYDGTVACGTAVYSKFARLGMSGLTEIKNGVAFHWPIQTHEIRRDAKARLGIADDAVLFVCVGRMDGVDLAGSPKGHSSLISAWQQTQIAKVRGELHLIGDGPLKAALKSLVTGDEKILFQGIQPEPHRWLLAADCFVMPSRWEGLPIAGIEGIGTGLQCILSDIASLRELKPPNVCWVGVDDVDELAAALDNACVERDAPAAEEIREFRQNFGIAGCAEKYLALYLG